MNYEHVWDLRWSIDGQQHAPRRSEARRLAEAAVLAGTSADHLPPLLGVAHGRRRARRRLAGKIAPRLRTQRHGGPPSRRRAEPAAGCAGPPSPAQPAAPFPGPVSTAFEHFLHGLIGIAIAHGDGVDRYRCLVCRIKAARQLGAGMGETLRLLGVGERDHQLRLVGGRSAIGPHLEHQLPLADALALKRRIVERLWRRRQDLAGGLGALLQPLRSEHQQIPPMGIDGELLAAGH